MQAKRLVLRPFLRTLIFGLAAITLGAASQAAGRSPAIESAAGADWTRLSIKSRGDIEANAADGRDAVESGALGLHSADRTDRVEDTSASVTTPRPEPIAQEQVKADADQAKFEADQRALLYGRGLRGLQSVAVKVNLTEASFRKPVLWTSEGITEAQLKREIETALDAAGVTVVPAISQSSPGLRISASSIDTAYGSYEISVEMRLLDRVTISRSGVSTLAITWKHSLSGYLDERHDASDSRLLYLDNPRQLIRRGVNSFVNDWLRANTEGDVSKETDGGVRDAGRDYVVPEQALLDMAILLSLDRRMTNSATSSGNDGAMSVGHSVLQSILTKYFGVLGLWSDKVKRRHNYILRPGTSEPYTNRFSYIDLPPMSLVEYLQAHAQGLQDPNESARPPQ